MKETSNKQNDGAINLGGILLATWKICCLGTERKFMRCFELEGHLVDGS